MKTKNYDYFISNYLNSNLNQNPYFACYLYTGFIRLIEFLDHFDTF